MRFLIFLTMTLFPIQNPSIANFANLYHFGKVIIFLKVHKEIKWNCDIPHDTCASKVCENITLLIRGLNPNLVQKLPEDPDKVFDKFTCSKENYITNCM